MTIVCCTAVSDIETKKEALDAGMNEVLEKPIQRDKLSGLLELYLWIHYFIVINEVGRRVISCIFHKYFVIEFRLASID